MSTPSGRDHEADSTGEATEPLPMSVEQLAEGRYELGATLGSGGMGIVRLARDHRLGRDVAVKLLADNLAADPDARERFLREARAAAAISDPNVVAVFDVGDEAGRPYLVMELVNGPSLAEVLRREGAMVPSRVSEVATDALAGLAATHAAGIVHRDVKPGNLLQTPSGRVKLTDLGVAEAADAPGLTRTGLVVGTRSYLAPERLAGQDASQRTDLYALGVTLSELLLGRAPAEPTDWARDATWLPADLRRLLVGLLAADPGHRPDSAYAALRSLEQGDSVGASLTAPYPAAAGPAAAAATTAPAPQAGTTEAMSPETAVLTPTPGTQAGTNGAAPVSDRPRRAWWWLAAAGFAAIVIVAAIVQLGLLAPGQAERADDGVSPTETDTTTDEQAPSGGDEAPAAEEPPAAEEEATAEEATEEPPAAEEAPSADEDDGVPRAEDPADTARNLAEWLRP